MIGTRRNILIAGGLLLLSSTQSAHALNRGDNFRSFREQNPNLDRRTARVQYQSLHRNGVGGASLPSGSGLTLAKPDVHVMTMGKDGIVRCGAPLARQNRLDRIAERTGAQSIQVNGNGNIVRLSNSVNLDLTSQEKNITLGKNLFGDQDPSVTIDVGGQSKTVSAGSQVTAAEYIAVKQALAGGQSVSLDSRGKAVGGSIDLAALTDDNDVMRASALVVAANVTTYGDFGRRSDFRLLGNLDNYGTVETLSSDSSVRGGAVRAQDINNHAGALINSKSNLLLDASGDLINEGTINSAQALTLQASGRVRNSGSVNANSDLNVIASTVDNSGNLSSNSGSITFIGSETATLNVNNAGGTISAVNGSINLRNSEYAGSENSYLTGGNLFSRDLNLYSGLGEAHVRVNELTGHINEYGSAAHVLAATETLSIGDVCLTGDPTFYNLNGNIQINGNVTVAEDLVVVAKGNITSIDNITIKADDGVNGRPVTLIAGADFFTDGGKSVETLPANAADAGDLALSGRASKTGGAITLGKNVTIDTRCANKSGDRNGGFITMYAFAGQAVGSGVIDISGTTLLTGGSNFGVNGNISLIAGAKSGVAITTGNVDTTGGLGKDFQTGIVGGGLALVSSQPAPFPRGPVVYFSDGSLQLNRLQFSKKLNNSNLVVGSNGATTKLESIFITVSNGDLNIKNSITANDSVVLQTGTLTFDPTTVPFKSPQLEINVKSGSLGSEASPFKTQADRLFLTSQAGDVFATTSSANIVQIAGGARNTFDIAADSGSVDTFDFKNSVNTTVTGKKVDLSAFKFIKAFAGGEQVILRGLDPNTDFNGGVKGGKSLTLDFAGSIGSLANPFSVEDYGTIKMVSDKNVFAEQKGKKTVTWDLEANNKLSFQAETSTKITHAVSVLDTVTIKGLNRTLTIAGDVVGKNGVSIVNTAAKSGKIAFAAGSTVDTTAKSAGQGDINISVGPAGAPLVGTPANVQVTLKGGAVNITGSGVKAKAPTNELIAEGADININNGFGSGSITFGGDVDMHADPPVPEGTPILTYAGPVRDGVSVLSTARALEVSDNPSMSFPQSLQPVISNDFAAINTFNINAIDSSRLNLLYLGEKCNLAPDDSYMFVAHPDTFEHEATLCTDLELSADCSDGRRGTVSIPFNGRISLDNGSALICADRDTVINTAHGDVSILKGAMALVSVSDRHLSVFDIFDSYKDSVTVDCHGSQLTLSPGRHLTLTDDSVASFSQVNPVEAIPHRTLSRHSLSQNKCLFQSEFSIADSVAVVKPLRSIMQSGKKQAKKIASRLIKTAAVVAHLSRGSERFAIHGAPKTVALK